MSEYARLSSPIQDIRDHYTVVVVGSGYGGGIAASRFARAKQQVCLLERGLERQPGEFPENELEAAEQLQTDAPEGHVGCRTGMYDLRLNPDINVFVGCGLGGTSLVNANVSMRADARVFDDPRWPKAIRQDTAGLERGYALARDMLRPNALPALFDPPKLRALTKSAQVIGATVRRTEINVTMADSPTGRNHVGVPQQRCNMCGDCVSGCNHGAKNTTLMNYLPDAVNHGAEIYTEVEVRRVSRRDDGKWLVHYRILGAQREAFDAPEQTVSADVVVLSAGTLGSTEILLRSKAHGLETSSQLGQRFTGNGDVLGFAYNCDQPINGIGWGHRSQGQMHDPMVGPCITGVIEIEDAEDVNQEMIIEEGSLPGPLGAILPEALAIAADAVGRNLDGAARHELEEKARRVESALLGPYYGAVQNTQTYLVMTHEKTSGSMLLVDDRLRVAWPNVGREEIFEKVDQRLQKVTEALHGTYVRNPLWTELFKHHLITVHPLGGCTMGDSAESAVVDHKGQVFSGTSGSQVYEGLHVADGSVIPRSLGCNPLLTICAVAERSCALIAQAHGWTIDYDLGTPPVRQPRPRPIGIEFTERMVGNFSTVVTTDFASADADGKKTGSTFEFILTIAAQNLDELLHNEDYQAHIVGSVRAPALSPSPLVVTGGRFNLLVVDPDRVGGKNMRYRMQLHSEEGQSYWFEGTKYIANERGLDVWPDTTTLYVTVSEGAAPGGKLVGRGILHILPEDFLKQLRATRALNAPSSAQGLAAVARFGEYFAGSLWDVYGGVAAKPSVFNPDAAPRKRRLLRAPAPEVYPFSTPDGTSLRLTRYKGGEKGPVMLAHGLGVSSLIFSIDTIETNLLEFLVAHGYDVWLLDFRSSIALEAHHRQYTGDDIARQDFPAAVATIQQVTGKRDIQVVAHCFGATTFTMAMLAGLQGVRSSVISQISTRIYTPTSTRLKTGLHVPDFLQALGVGSLTAYVDTHSDWKSRLFDRALKLYPTEFEERCASPTCHRIAFLYAPLYEHDQLNTATHDAMHEMFGEATMGAFQHLGVLSNTTRMVAADGSNVYLPWIQRLAIPTLFVHGAENACFLPRSTAETMAELSEANGKSLYQRKLIPNYGHIDCIFGKNAVRDVYPHILEHLEATL